MDSMRALVIKSALLRRAYAGLTACFPRSTVLLKYYHAPTANLWNEHGYAVCARFLQVKKKNEKHYAMQLNPMI